MSDGEIEEQTPANSIETEMECADEEEDGGFIVVTDEYGAI